MKYMFFIFALFTAFIPVTQHIVFAQDPGGPVDATYESTTVYTTTATDVVTLPIVPEPSSIQVPQFISEEHIWSPSQGIYSIENDVVVGEGGKITIMPGTTIHFGQYARLVLRGGVVISEGTQDAPVLFTAEDTTKQFTALYVSEKGKAELSHTIVQNAFAGIRIDYDGTAIVHHTQFENCTYGTLTIGGTLSVYDSVFKNAPPHVDMGTLFSHQRNKFLEDIYQGWVLLYNGVADNSILENIDGAYTILPIFLLKEGHTMRIKEGVHLKFIDAPYGMQIAGAVSFEGTANNPIIVESIGSCTNHTPIITLYGGSLSVQHTQFRKLCGGISGRASFLKIPQGVTAQGISQLISIDNPEVIQYVSESGAPGGGAVGLPDEVDNGLIPEPLIIIPGITGSRLSKGYGNNEEVWPAIRDISFSLFDEHIEALRLQDDGTPDSNRPIVVGDIIRSITFPLYTVHFFDGLIDILQHSYYQEGSNLFVFPYDWRLPIETTAQQLNQFISSVREKTGAQSVRIIAHSMGGLVTKSYVHQFGATVIKSIMFIGAPQLGAPIAGKTIAYGDDMGIGFGISLLNQQTIKKMADRMYSLYQLLPSKEYIERIGEVFDTATESLFSFADGLVRNEVLHRALDTMSMGTVPVYSIAGCGTPTLASIQATRRWHFTYGGFIDASGIRLQFTPAGDGTVPLQSADYLESTAQNSAVHHYYTTEGTHGGLPSAVSVRNAIASFLSGKPPEMSSSFSDTTAICTTSGIGIETIGPLKVQIYNTVGQHTGIDERGYIVSEDPSVGYAVLSDQTAAMIPFSGEYKMMYALTSPVTETVGATVVTILITQPIENKQWKQFVFQLPSLPSGTTLYTYAKQGIVDPLLQVDLDTDGVIEHTIEAMVRTVSSPDVPISKTMLTIPQQLQVSPQEHNEDSLNMNTHTNAGTGTIISTAQSTSLYVVSPPSITNSITYGYTTKKDTAVQSKKVADKIIKKETILSDSVSAKNSSFVWLSEDSNTVQSSYSNVQAVSSVDKNTDIITEHKNWLHRSISFLRQVFDILVRWIQKSLCEHFQCLFLYFL